MHSSNEGAAGVKMRWNWLAGIVFLLFIVHSGAAIAAEPMTADELTLLQLVNEDRRQAGKAPLAPNDALADVARRHAADMLAYDYFAHNDRLGRSPFDRMKAAKIAFTAAAENIYKGLNDPVGPDLTIAEAFLMQSPGHRRNILDGDFTEIGIGLVRSDDGWLYVVQCFIRPPQKR